MSFTIDVLPSGNQFTVNPDESILEAALRSDLAFPYGCRGGACGSCIGKVVSGEVRYDEEPMGLSAEEAVIGMALFCIAKPVGDLTIEVHELDVVEQNEVRELPVRVAAIERLRDDIMVLSIALPEQERLRYRAGQYVDFVMADGSKRAFSIANAPRDNRLLEFHVRHIRDGKITGQIFNEITEGAEFYIEGPKGSFFLREKSDRPIIMLATGTGFGPLKAILEQLVAEQSNRPVYLYWGMRSQDELYADAMIRGWAESFPNIRYCPVLSCPDAQWDGHCGYVQEAVVADFETLERFEVYACGHTEMVRQARDILVAKGVATEHFYADAFEWGQGE